MICGSMMKVVVYSTCWENGLSCRRLLNNSPIILPRVVMTCIQMLGANINAMYIDLYGFWLATSTFFQNTHAIYIKNRCINGCLIVNNWVEELFPKSLQKLLVNNRKPRFLILFIGISFLCLR